jgi:hypothetical protein
MKKILKQIAATGALVGLATLGVLFIEDIPQDRWGFLKVNRGERLWDYATQEGCTNNKEKVEWISRVGDANLHFGPKGQIYDQQEIRYWDKNSDGYGGTTNALRKLRNWM